MASKIKVDTIENVAGSGNVSLGSGHNLVVPGNLTVDTSTLKVDSSNNRVGMGTASPSRQVMISRSIADGSGELGIVSSDSSTSGALGNIHFGNSTDTSLASIRATADGATDSAKLEFNTEKTGAAIETAMRLDSNGRVTTPRQPSFMVRGNNANWVSVSNGSTAIIEFDGNTTHNVGSHYSTANDRFVAPVAGIYLFSVNAYVDTGGSSSDSSPYGYIRLRKNGSNIPGVHHIYGYLNAEDHDQAVGLTAILELSASDYIQVALQAAGGAVRHYGDSSVFFGHLLG